MHKQPHHLAKEWFARFRENEIDVLCAADIWRQEAVELVSSARNADTDSPEDFWCLTDALMAWCDLEFSSIDPSTLDSVRRQIFAYLNPNERFGEPPPQKTMEETLRQAISILERLELATLIRCDNHKIPLPPMDHGPDPFQKGMFYWDGRVRRISEENWKLLLVVWKKTEDITLETISEEIASNGENRLETVKKRILKLNREMALVNVPLSWDITEERIHFRGDWPE